MIFKYRILFLALLLFSLFQNNVSAQTSTIKQGKLANGLSYYLVHDKNFRDEAHFFLFQNVGAVLEKDAQNGLAHYLEHMAFNSTEHFPQGVMNFLRANGIYTFDAHTGSNETQYALYNISTKNQAMIDSMLFILKDWCNGISLNKKDMDKERSIILEEWRQRNNVDKRLSDAIAPYIYNHSEYAYRNTIGSEKSIKNFNVKDIRDFYNSWYCPQLQYIAIIGDIDLEIYEKKVQQLFSKIPDNKPIEERKDILIKENVTPVYYRFIDKENTTNSFGFYQRLKTETNLDEEVRAKQHLMQMIFNQLTSHRLAMLKNDGIEEFIAASISYQPLVRRYAQNAWDVVPYDGREQEALKQILSIRESIRREGFNESDFEEVKEAIYSDMKSILSNDNLGTPDNYMDIFKQNYLYGIPLKTFEKTLNQLIEQLVELEVSDFNNWIKSWMDDNNLSFITYSNDTESVNISLEQFENTLQTVKESPTMTFSQPDKIENLIDFEIEKGKIVSEKTITELETEEWMLSNGSRLLYKYIPELKDEIYFVGSNQGGRSLVRNEDLPSYNAMEALVMKSGLYNYNRNQLYHWIKDKDINLSLNITDYTDGLGGNASLKDAENFFKYLYLVINRHNFKEDVFKKYVEREKYLYKTRNTSGIAAVKDSIQELLFPYSDANPKKDIDFYNRMKHSELLRLYNDRLGNFAGFTFCLIGAIPKEKAVSLIEKYIASLPGDSSTPKRTYKLIDFSSKEKDITREFWADIKDEIGEVELSFSNTHKLSTKEIKALSILEGILQNRFFGELREKEGGTYSVGVNANYIAIPSPYATLNIHFETERTKVDKLKKTAYRIIDKIAKGDFTENEFKNVFVTKVAEENKRNEFDEKQADPLIWLGILNEYAEKDILPDKEEDDIKMESITPADVAHVLNKLLKDAKRRDIVVKSIPLEKKTWIH